MRSTRRDFISMVGATALANLAADFATTAAAQTASDSGLKVSVAAESPWMVNQVAVTSKNLMFLGLPRYPDHETTPSVVRKEADGTLRPFPGHGWNDWKPGDDGLNAFVYVNSVHIFADDTVWCVDQGMLRPDAGPPTAPPPALGAQKIVQFDPKSGAVLKILRFSADIIPPGAQINDLRLKGDDVYITDSGIGGLIYHNLATGKTLRRMSGLSEMMALPSPPPATQPGAPPAKHRVPKSDMIELSADGDTLYWAAPTGPFRRIATALLRDPGKTDEELAKHVEIVADIALIGGSAMDSKGNLYLSELKNKRVTILSPQGKTAVVASSPEFLGPDNAFIGNDRRLYVPVSQAGRTRLFGNPTDLTEKPFKVFSVELPKELAGISIGESINLPNK